MLAQSHDLKLDAADYPYGVYADDFLKAFLGAERVMSLDCSAFEHCDIVHDMNRPIDPSHHGTFDVVIDGGSLEHIFNFPVALANCMKLVKVGGSLFIFTPANNDMGHGFYQFSPELFFRIFDEKYGFRICDAVLESRPYPSAELSPRSRCYSVTDPALVRSRVQSGLAGAGPDAGACGEDSVPGAIFGLPDSIRLRDGTRRLRDGTRSGWRSRW
jgi:SAM-dependent methyltransferase